MNGPHQKRSHEWAAPPPGQGRDKICRHCGARMSVIGKGSECGGTEHEAHTIFTDEAEANATLTEHQYDAIR